MDPIAEALYRALLPRKRDSQGPGRIAKSHREERFSLLEEMRNPGYAIPELTTSAFVDNILPPLNGGISVKNIVKSLKRGGLIGSKGRRKHAKRTSGDMLASLVGVFDKATSVASGAAPHLEQIVEMVQLPNRCRNSSRRTKLPSACFVLKDTSKRDTLGTSSSPRSISWVDFALPVEFMKSDCDTSSKRSASRIVSGIQQIMARDPCRRFAFGITIENTSMRLWFCSRATPVVSQPFDFMTTPDLLIHVLLSLAFASKDELGWDPTVRPFIRDDGERVYHIDVDDETYETERVLASTSSEELVGHATRVWEVRHLETGKSYVLKDCWMEDDRDLEHEIYREILHDVEAKYGTDVRKQVASHLVTPMMHWLVDVNGAEDHTTRVMMRGHEPSFRRNVKVESLCLARLPSTSGSDSCGSSSVEIQDPVLEGLRDPLPWCNPFRKVIGRKHYRVVFGELASAVHKLRDLAEVFTVLWDSAKALSWIHGCGWVHRDISIGNLYMYRGRGLIGDLEYAKRRNTDVSKELRTGTPDFMAVEAAGRIYDYLPEEDDEQIEAGPMSSKLRSTSKSEPPAFFHNDLHDLESLWWIALWVLFSNCPCSDADSMSPNDRLQDEQREAELSVLFPSNSELRTNRRLFLQSRDEFHSRTVWVPECFRSIRAVLNTLRLSLNHKYLKFETAFPEHCIEPFEEAHEVFLEHFGRCKELATSVVLTTYVTIARRTRSSRTEDSGRNQASAISPTRIVEHTTERGESGPEPVNHAPDSVIGIGVNRPVAIDSCVPTKCFVRVGKRKRDDDDDGVPSKRPFHVARRQLQVF